MLPPKYNPDLRPKPRSLPEHSSRQNQYSTATYAQNRGRSPNIRRGKIIIPPPTFSQNRGCSPNNPHWKTNIRQRLTPKIEAVFRTVVADKPISHRQLSLKTEAVPRTIVVGKPLFHNRLSLKICCVPDKYFSRRNSLTLEITRPGLTTDDTIIAAFAVQPRFTKSHD